MMLYYPNKHKHEVSFIISSFKGSTAIHLRQDLCIFYFFMSCLFVLNKCYFYHPILVYYHHTTSYQQLLLLLLNIISQLTWCIAKPRLFITTSGEFITRLRSSDMAVFKFSSFSSFCKSTVKALRSSISLRRLLR